MRPVHILTSYFLSCMLTFLCSLLRLGIPSARYMPRLSYPPWLNHLMFVKTQFLLLGTHSGTDKYSSLHECCAVSLGKQMRKFQQIITITNQYGIPTHETWIFMVYAALISSTKIFMFPLKSVRSPHSYSQRWLVEIRLYEGSKVYGSVLCPPHFRNTNKRVSIISVCTIKSGMNRNSAMQYHETSPGHSMRQVTSFRHLENNKLHWNMKCCKMIQDKNFIRSSWNHRIIGA